MSKNRNKTTVSAKLEPSTKQAEQKKNPPRFNRLYIVTAISTATVCLVIVIITAQISRSATRWNEKNPISVPTPIPVDSLLNSISADNIISTPIPVSTPLPIPTATQQSEKISAKDETEDIMNQEATTVGLFKKNEPFTLKLPISGEVLNPFSGNRLQKSKTLGDWRTHNGIDFKADTGTPVNAAADGTILRAEYDTMTGYTVVIEHTERYQTIYSNLASAEMVEPGQSIRVGECLGAVGDSAVFEKLEDSHLHFELIENGVYQNPLDYVG